MMTYLPFLFLFFLESSNKPFCSSPALSLRPGVVCVLEHLLPINYEILSVNMHRHVALSTIQLSSYPPCLTNSTLESSITATESSQNAWGARRVFLFRRLSRRAFDMLVRHFGATPAVARKRLKKIPPSRTRDTLAVMPIARRSRVPGSAMATHLALSRSLTSRKYVLAVT